MFDDELPSSIVNTLWPLITQSHAAEFQVIVVLISSPVALLVALRGMTNKVISQREQYAAQLLEAKATKLSGSIN